LHSDFHKIFVGNFIFFNKPSCTTNIVLLSLTNSHIPTSELNRPVRKAEHLSPSNSDVKNEWSYISTSYAYNSVCALARLLSPPCLTIYIIFRLQNFHFLPPRFKPTSPQIRGVIPGKVQAGIIMYQFTVWPRKDVQMFKFRHKSETLWICRHPAYRPRTSLVILKVTQTNVSVKDAAETRDYVASTVVIVLVCSNCVILTTGVWKVPGENHAPLPIFCNIT
jgi:hypothetical protein